MPGLALPSFPEAIQTHPLLVIDYELIKSGDAKESDRLWEAATGLGFWYLKNHGADEEVDAIFDMGEAVMNLPMEEKLKFSESSLGEAIGSFGYKAEGEFMVDKEGTPDAIEFITIAKDDILAYPKVVHRAYPTPVGTHIDSALRPFLGKALEVNMTILSVFEKKLGLANGELLKLHTMEAISGSEARVLKAPAKLASPDPNKPKVALFAHTDLGSLAFLHNRLGGLQVLPPGTNDWQYVRPLPGHAICNVGDTLAVLSGGLLQSSMHRVVPPPGPQGDLPRWSVVFQTRPGHNVHLRALAEESPVIRAALERTTPEQREKFSPNITTGEWFARRVKNFRVSNRTGPENWLAGRGMEHNPNAV